MQTPVSTYRLQLSPEFTFENLQLIIDYLYQLQISTVYAAPIFQSMEGSTHGYDIVNPLVINQAIGDLEGLRKIRSRLKDNEMGWLQDIVPNHMANSPLNPWICSVLEHGPASPYYHFFDINWEYPAWKGKIMAPFLGESLDEAIENGNLKIIYNENGCWFQYYDNEYPLNAKSYFNLLSMGEESKEIKHWIKEFKNYPTHEVQWRNLKKEFYEAVLHQQSLRKYVETSISKFNASKDKLLGLLDLQFFKPAYWKEAEKEINFRRFFTINDLICLRMEKEEVFREYHTFIHKMCQEGLINGVRIDHIDGLYDPGTYLNRLNHLFGKDFYCIIEKILEADETLPKDWEIQGTSGYDFLAMINNLFTSTKNKAAFLEYYQRIKPEFSDYPKLVFEMKQYILHERMGGELQNLWRLLEELNQELEKPDLIEDTGIKALSAFLAAFPVYRIYPTTFPLSPGQKKVIVETYLVAKKQVPELKRELDYIRDIFLGEAGTKKVEMGNFLKRCQQFTGPLTAKGVEDTTFYRYHLLISHNEVGDSPEVFGISISEFHKKMEMRQRFLPHTLNTTATHDTKRGEDARMRINVLSEIPEEWFGKVDEWHQTNKSLRDDPKVPDLNEEYLIYQSLIGAMGFENEIHEDFLSRTTAFLKKALREAKEHTSWSDPDQAYEALVFSFVQKILNHESFRTSFDPFQRKIEYFGVINSLGQSLIKILAPGIPDTYQGSELWDLSYVDPDNRRPVDFGLRKKYLDEIQAMGEKVDPNTRRNMIINYKNGKIKLYTIFRALNQRRLRPSFFEKAAYLPVKVSFPFEDRVISFARHKNDFWYLVVVPLNPTALFEPGQFPFINDWENGFLELPALAPKTWINVYTGERITFKGQMPLSSIFSGFPVALLRSIDI